jgi:lambda family phage tail tape measure protein
MLREAREKDLQSSKHWEDGLKRGFRDVLNEAEDMASQTERLVKNAFKGMEDALVEFVTTGKLDFKSLADSIIADLVRIQIRQSITQPLANALDRLILVPSSGQLIQVVSSVVMFSPAGMLILRCLSERTSFIAAV